MKFTDIVVTTSLVIVIAGCVAPLSFLLWALAVGAAQ